jgi:FAD/FMN-containing dehydrogenase
MNRRALLKRLGAVPFAPLLTTALAERASAGSGLPGMPYPRRVRPNDAAWPDAAAWESLNRQTGGRLIAVTSPFQTCAASPNGAACADALNNIRNPFYVGDQPGLTQTSGWIDAWTSTPSTYAVAAETTADVVAAVNFAREKNLRLVVKGGGHSYQGTSDSGDSLLIWTRKMNAIVLHDAFVPTGCAGVRAPQPAVTIEAGAMWIDAYDAVTTKGGRYVQGGGCATVGVAGLIQSGGFGSFSKNFGTAAAGLLEAEIVTADGIVRTANACTHEDLFWGIKGGGGGSLGVVTKLTLRTRELPAYFGGVKATVKASSDAAFRKLIDRFVAFYGESLFNAHWGESVHFGRDNTFEISMVFFDLDKQQANDAWKPFFDWLAASPADYALASPPLIGAVPARDWWNAGFWAQVAPGAIMVPDSRPGAPGAHAWWAGDGGQVGFYLYGYDSTWLPASLLRASSQETLAEALFASSRHWDVALHCNKGLGGAPATAVAAAADTAMNPAVLDAFALAIIGDAGDPAYPGMPGPGPDRDLARRRAADVAAATAELRKIGATGSYVSESNYFNADWQQAFWGEHYPKLAAVKKKYDPAGLFFVHHGVGSEEWSADGFVRIASA